MKTLPSILDNARGRVIALVSAFGVAEAAAMGLAAFATRDIFSALRTDTGEPPVSALVQLGLAGVLVALARFGNRSAAEWLGHSFATSTRRVLFGHLARMEQSTIEARRAGSWGLRFVGDLGSLRSWVGRGLPDTISAAIVLPCAVLVLWMLDPTLAIHALVPVVIALVLMLGLTVWFERVHRRVRSKRANIAIDMMERVSSAAHLDLMGRRGKEVRRLDKSGDELKERATRRAVLRVGLRSIPEIGAALGGVGVLWAAWNTQAAAAEAAAALAVLGIIAAPLRGLAFVWDRRVAWQIAREKIETVLRAPTVRRRRSKEDGPIGFEADALASHGLPLTLALGAGEKTVLTGPPAGGTSTALRLLAGLDEPDSGTLTFDCEEDRRPDTLILSDDSPMMYGSLRRNLTLGVRGKRPKDDRILSAAREAGLGDLVERIGLDGKVGAEGMTLSRRERLAVLLVRAILATPQLLLVDLAEIAIDPALTALLQDIVAKTDATAVVVWPRRAIPLPGLPVHDLETKSTKAAAA